VGFEAMNLYCENPIIDQHVDRLLGPTIAMLLREGKVQEISVNADGRIRIDDGGQWEHLIDAEPIPAAFAETAIRMIASVNNIWIDPDAPFVETNLACGARFSASHPPIADGVEFTIRTHARIFRPLTAFMTADQADWTRREIKERKNIIVAGGTNTGKTTLVNSMISEIDERERLGVVEDITELQIPEGRNVIRFLTSAKVSMRQHVRAMLRYRPDRIIVSEVRGEEAFDMVQAMLTGHSGCLSTVHANSAEEALNKIADYANYPLNRVQVAINTVLHLRRQKDGNRRLSSIWQSQSRELEEVQGGRLW
jgi:type IV secretion system protein TrbB